MKSDEDLAFIRTFVAVFSKAEFRFGPCGAFYCQRPV